MVEAEEGFVIAHVHVVKVGLVDCVGGDCLCCCVADDTPFKF